MGLVLALALPLIAVPDRRRPAPPPGAARQAASPSTRRAPCDARPLVAARTGRAAAATAAAASALAHRAASRRASSAPTSPSRSTAPASSPAPSRCTSRCCRLRACRAGVVFLIAGGPGQGSAHVYGLGDDCAVSLYRFLFPGYTLVAYDDRGHRRLGPARLPVAADEPPRPTASRRPRRRARTRSARSATSTAPPSTRRISRPSARRSASTRSRSSASPTAPSSRWRTHSRTRTTSSGCCSTRSCRPSSPTRTRRTSLRNLPATLNVVLLRRRLPWRDARLRRRRRRRREQARREAAHRQGDRGERTHEDRHGRRRRPALDHPRRRPEPGPRRRAPCGRQGRPLRQHPAAAPPRRPAERQRHRAVDRAERRALCGDGLPRRSVPLGARHAGRSPSRARAGRRSRLCPPGSFGPFGTWAARFGNADFCLDWPSPAGGAALGAGPLPERARARDQRRLRHAHARPQAPRPSSRGSRRASCSSCRGSATARSPPTSPACAARAVHSWMTNAAVPTTCARPKALVVPVPALPPPGQAKPKHRASPGGDVRDRLEDDP